MSLHSGSPSPLQMAANGHMDEATMPRGHCRYILLHPEIKGQRCACAAFSLNKDIPGSTCDCGHLACFHNQDPEASSDQRHELDLLKRRLQLLEEQLSKGQDDVLASVVNRLNEVEDHLEKSKEEVGEQIKGAYRNVSMSWRSIEQAEHKTQQQDEQLRQIYHKLRDHDEQLNRVHAGQLELRDADLSLEERIENLTETLEAEEEMRMSTALTTEQPSSRRPTPDTSYQNIPLGPLGEGAAHRQPYPSPSGGPVTSIPPTKTPAPELHGATGRDVKRSPHHHHHSPRPALSPSSARRTESWTVHISLLPHAYVPMPFERNTTAYQRCLSRGLHRMVAVQGRDAASFKQAVEKAFGHFIRGREWILLQAKLCDTTVLQGLPILRQVDNPAHQRHVVGGSPGCDYDFLRKNCAIVDPRGVIDSLYIAMRTHTISWHTLRRAPIFMEGLEDCWAHDPLLDNDPFDDADMAVDDEARPAAGDLTAGRSAAATVTSVVGAVAGLKRPSTEMSRSDSFGPGANTTASTSLSKASTTSNITPATTATKTTSSTVEAVEDEARVKRTCQATPSTKLSPTSTAPPSMPVSVSVSAAPTNPGTIVDIGRRYPIKTA
ncbi:hypothetical protein B0J18DRAFT_131213 [Chaetomium sp. MPI-SDFR-AT-0129]|nr:hypothetical protein B0J18DRAFT_131213 [Chaetomium sp. MPI-SDFR-AT-0129]